MQKKKNLSVKDWISSSVASISLIPMCSRTSIEETISYFLKGFLHSGTVGSNPATSNLLEGVFKGLHKAAFACAVIENDETPNCLLKYERQLIVS